MLKITEEDDSDSEPDPIAEALIQTWKNKNLAKKRKKRLPLSLSKRQAQPFPEDNPWAPPPDDVDQALPMETNAASPVSDVSCLIDAAANLLAPSAILPSVSSSPVGSIPEPYTLIVPSSA